MDQKMKDYPKPTIREIFGEAAGANRHVAIPTSQTPLPTFEPLCTCFGPVIDVLWGTPSRLEQDTV